MRVRVLGGLRVDGVAERDLGSRKGRTLVKVLALARGAPVGVDRLADVLWGDTPPARPGDQVGVLVSRLRGVLGADRLVRSDAGYALRLDWLDVDELQALTDAAASALAEGRLGAARAATEAALGLARGPLLPDEDGEWVEADRAVAQATVARARGLAVEAALAAGDVGAAASLAEAALGHDPYDEAALRALMQAHLAAGRPASALAAYARVRHRLAEDLGVPPTAATEALHAAALAAADGDRAPAGPPPGPTAPTTPLVGRARELAALDEAAAAGPGLALLWGPAGIGKTTLVEHWSRGRRVIAGRCDELGRDLPLQPLADGLAAHLQTVGSEAAAALVGDEATALAALLGAPDRPAEPSAPIDAETGRVQLFGALLAVLERAADVVVVEDLHEAGRSTLEWLAFAQRRARRLLVLGTARSDLRELAGASRIELGMLDVDAVAELVGPERAPELHARSGGHPLLLTAMASAPEGALPHSVRAAVDAAAAALGPEGEDAVRAAAVLGDDVDVELLASLLQVPAVSLLGPLEAAAAAGLLVERGARFASRHALIREALESAVGPARRALLHRAAAVALAERDADPLTVAVHARAGGETALASRSFAAAAEVALARFDVAAAERHADEAVALEPSAAARLARARLRMALFRLEEAAADAERAVACGGGAPALELAGWVAYYRRRYAEARRAADEAIALATDDALRARCLALAGRVRHGSGDLRAAVPLLEEAHAGPAAVRAVPAVWLAAACVHQGRAADALAVLDAVALDEPSAHPFVPLHGRFARVVALGHLGRAAEALAAADELWTVAQRAGAVGTRFLGVTANMRGWVLRWTGRLEEADDAVAAGLDHSAGPGGLAPALDSMSEPFWVARLDLADGRLLAGDLEGAAAIEATLGGLETWQGTMAWHQRHRLELLRARLALADGDRDRAAELAEGVRADAAARGARRYELLAAALAGTAAGPAADLGALDAVVAELATCAGLDGWRSVAELAAATGVARWQAEAERRRAAVTASPSPR